MSIIGIIAIGIGLFIAFIILLVWILSINSTIEKCEKLYYQHKDIEKKQENVVGRLMKIESVLEESAKKTS